MIPGLLVIWMLAHSGQDEDLLELTQAVPRMGSPSKQLEHARRLKNARRGRPPEERARSAADAIAAFRAVRRHFPWATRLGSEAAFRGGELLSATGRTAEALAEFEFAIRSGDGTPFRARAGLASGRLHRRRGDLDAAYAAFVDVAASPDTSHARCYEAWIWIGRVRAEAGLPEEARIAWREVTRHARDPLDRIEAYDFIGLTWLDRGDLEAAAGVLNECLRRHSEPALEATRTGARVRLSLARMRLVRRLRSEIEARLRSRQIEGTPRKR